MTKKRRKIICETLDEAKKEVLRLVQQGVSFRDIVQIEFQIGDRIKHFSIGETSKIKNESTGKVDEFKNKDQDASFVFMLLDKGRHPTDIIIEHKLNPDFVKGEYIKYLELKGIKIISEETFNNITNLISRLKVFGDEDPRADLDKDHIYLEDAVNYFLDPENF